MPNAIHHTEILRDETVKGKVKYRYETVNTIEAMQRYRRKEDVVNREHGERVAFVCSLRPGDVIETAKSPGEPRQLWRVRTVKASGQLAMHLLTDARMKADIQKAKCLWEPVVNTLFSNGARRVAVSHLGKVIPAND
jgi:hypothetical protein